jgi:transcriptional regulator with XRE-family HTH domain
MAWWVELGYPPFDLGKGGFPRTGQVIKYYREHKLDEGGKPLKQEALARVLGITEQAVGNLESRGAGLDSDRRRFLCKFLGIPPILLGVVMLEDIESLVEQQKEKVSWWVELGHPSFAPGKDGLFPRTGQVVKYYRERKMDNKGKAWTQEALARVLGISEQAVRDIENKDAGMDHERRHFLSRLFGIPPILFGILSLEEILKKVEEHKAVQQATPIASTASRTAHKLLIDVEEYTALLTDYWITFISNPARCSIMSIFLRIDALYRELPYVRDEKPICELLCRYHDLVANVLCDQQRYDDAILHLGKALRFATWLNKDEIKALVLYDYGYPLRLLGRLDEAVRKYEEARRYEQKLRVDLRGSLLLDTGSAEAMVAKTPEKKREAIALIDRVGNMVRSKEVEEDPYFLDLNLDRYHLVRSGSLMAVGRSREAISELRLVKAGPEYPRRQALNDIYQAQAHFNLGEYDRVVDLAESGLVVVQAVNSEVNIARVEKISRKLKESPYRDSPDVARLEYLLGKR